MGPLLFSRRKPASAHSSFCHKNSCWVGRLSGQIHSANATWAPTVYRVVANKEPWRGVRGLRVSRVLRGH